MREPQALDMPEQIGEAALLLVPVSCQIIICCGANVQAKTHVDLMEALDLIDFDSAADVSGSKFYYLRNAAALLEMALVNMTIQVQQLPGCCVLCLHRLVCTGWAAVTEKPDLPWTVFSRHSSLDTVLQTLSRWFFKKKSVPVTAESDCSRLHADSDTGSGAGQRSGEVWLPAPHGQHTNLQRREL
jgi:hypothetical protein